MKRQPALAAAFLAVTALMMLCAGCDDDPTAPDVPDGGYGLLRSGMVFDFSRGIETERDTLSHDLELYLDRSSSCSGDSCNYTATVTLAAPAGGKIIDLGPVSMSSVEWIPAAGYVWGLSWAETIRVPRYSTFIFDGIGAACVDHTCAVVDPDGNAYLMTVLNAPVSGTYSGYWNACLEFVWRRFP